MREIIKTYRQSVPALRFIDKKYGKSDSTVDEMGFEWHEDSKWCFERYVYPRFTVPDAKGNVILDIGFFIN